VSTLTTEPSAIGANDQDLAPGTEVGEYRIEKRIGKGGFGVVYAAVHPVIGKQVAIKVLARKYSADPEIVSRFVSEARAVNQIKHRHIIDIFSFGQLPDGRHYYVMEALDGDPLDSYLRHHGPMTLDEAAPVLRAIARALDAAHAKGIAHRDLKPENIFLARDADGAVFPKLLDFGIAKLLAPEDDVPANHKTNTGVPLGTPYYMSPEQCRGREVDHRTDIYSFGIVAYRMLTGAYPFDGEDYMELLYKQVNEEAPPPSSKNDSLPPSVDEAIAWMMRKDRTQRPPTVTEAVNALDPTGAVTPVLPPVQRGNKPTAPPRVVTDKKTASADALAATFTPEFERPQLTMTSPPPAEATSKSNLTKLVAVLAVLVVGAGATVFILARGETKTEPAPPGPSAPVVAPAAPAEPDAAVVVEAVGSGSATTPATKTKTPVATTRKKKEPAKVETGSATKPPDPDRPTSGKGDIIQLGSDTFKEQ